MDQYEHQSLKIISQFIKSKFLKKLAQLLLSISVFSFLLSNSRLSFLFSFNFYFSSISQQFFSQTMDKNCIFLLWNGLLVFVAKYSGLISSSPKFEFFNNYEVDGQPLELDLKEPFLESQLLAESIVAQKNVIVVQEREKEAIDRRAEDEETKKFIAQDEQEGEGEKGFLIIEKEGKDKQEEEELDDEFPMQEDEQEEEDEENGALSTEELNKKFEEFIRKRKEELRIEAQQQLVIVN